MEIVFIISFASLLLVLGHLRSVIDIDVIL